MAGVVTRIRVLKKSRKGLLAAGLLMLLVIPVACAGRDSADGGSGDTNAAVGLNERSMEAPDAMEAEEDSFKAAAGSTSTSGGGSGGSSDLAYTTAAPSAARLPRFGPSVIKTATIDIGLPKDEIGDAMNDAISIVGGHGGFVLSSSSGRGDSRGTLTMRIPSQKFEAALAELEGLGKVRSERITGQDVSQDFVDLEARLRNWESQEAVLLKLMDRAASVQDTIRVQGELSQVQLEIEQIRGRLRFLRDQTSYGTITASFGPVAPPVPSTPGRFARAWERAVDLMQGFVEGVIVASGVVLPLAFLAFLVYLVFRAVRPRLSA